MMVVNHHHDDDDTDKEEACISFLNSLFLSLSLSLSLTPRSIISVVLSVNVLLIISVVCFCVFEKKCLLLL